MARKDSKGRNLHTGESERKDGIYMYRYMDIRSGKRQTVYAGDLAALREKEKQIRRDLDDDILTDGAVKKMTLNALFDRYMATKDLAESTRTNYLAIWDNHIRGSLGNMRVIEILPSHIKLFYSELSKKGYSHSTIKLLHTILLPTLDMAVDDGIIRRNPAGKAFSGECGKSAKEKTALTQEQQEKLLSFLKSSNTYQVYIPMITVLLETGLRCGELIGLRWDDLDEDNNILSVDHQLIYKKYPGEMGYHFHATTPKTDAGIRKIPLTQKAAASFREQKKINSTLGRCPSEEIDGYSNFIFITKNGRPLMPNAVNNAIYNMVDAYNTEEARKAANQHRKAELLPKISVHDLRHTACTNMAKKNMNIKAMQRIMGHAKSNITMDIYNHLAEADLNDLKAAVESCEMVAGV